MIVRPMLPSMIPGGSAPFSLSLAKWSQQSTNMMRYTTRYYTMRTGQSQSLSRIRKPQSSVMSIPRRSSSGGAHHAPRPPHPMLESEKAARNRKIASTPESVTATSTTRQIFGELGDKAEEDEKDVDVASNLRHELEAVKETFSLSEAPREAFYIGLAGVFPYLATSLSTAYCAWEIKNEFGILLSRNSAEALLHVLEPLQIGYGAVILSCLGTVHWGLEWGKFGGTHGFPRYWPGVIAPAIAWPTILLPIESALIAQFLAFNFQYYYDTRATRRGWAPEWYSNYRFVLTFIVGASIVVSLIGRGQIADEIGKLPAPLERVKALRETQGQELSHNERARRAGAIMVKGEDEEDEEDEDEDDD